VDLARFSRHSSRWESSTLGPGSTAVGITPHRFCIVPGAWIRQLSLSNATSGVAQRKTSTRKSVHLDQGTRLPPSSQARLFRDLRGRARARPKRDQLPEGSLRAGPAPRVEWTPRGFWQQAVPAVSSGRAPWVSRAPPPMRLRGRWWRRRARAFTSTRNPIAAELAGPVRPVRVAGAASRMRRDRRAPGDRLL